jgi:RecA/RadA recombinase
MFENRDYNWRKCIEVLCFSTFRHPSFYQIKDGDNVIGNRTKVKIVKNSSSTFKVAEFDIMYGEGVSKT